MDGIVSNDADQVTIRATQSESIGADLPALDRATTTAASGQTGPAGTTLRAVHENDDRMTEPPMWARQHSFARRMEWGVTTLTRISPDLLTESPHL